jgi:hypothetical protein
MISMTKNIKYLLVAVICFGAVLKYAELRHGAVGKAADRWSSYLECSRSDANEEEDKLSYRTHSNVTFMARLAEEFPPRIRDYFLTTERSFLRKDGKERFMEYFKKSFPNPDEKLRYQMR